VDKELPILLSLIASFCILAVILGYLLYWYAFRFEPFNFKLSKIAIKVKINGSNLKENDLKNIKSSGIDNKNQETPEPAGLLKILHLSDFHLRKDIKGKKLFEFIKTLQPLNPDLIVITGDLVEKNENFDYLIDMLSGFNARLGKFVVFGVHDYYNKAVIEFIKNMFKKKRSYKNANDVDLLIKKLQSIGFKVLQNKKEVITLKSSAILSSDLSYDKSSNVLSNLSILPNLSNLTLEIVGVDDAVIEKADAKKAFNIASGKAINKAFMALNKVINKTLNKDVKIELSHEKPDEKFHFLNNSNKLCICLTHTPDQQLLKEISSYGADIILCGHTHGGQVRLPLIGAIITGANVKRKYASGLFYFKNFVLFTSRGLGEGRYSPFRFYCQPEAVLININFYKTS